MANFGVRISLSAKLHYKSMKDMACFFVLLEHFNNLINKDTNKDTNQNKAYLESLGHEDSKNIFSFIIQCI